MSDKQGRLFISVWLRVKAFLGTFISLEDVVRVNEIDWTVAVRWSQRIGSVENKKWLCHTTARSEMQVLCCVLLFVAVVSSVSACQTHHYVWGRKKTNKKTLI